MKLSSHGRKILETNSNRLVMAPDFRVTSIESELRIDDGSIETSPVCLETFTTHELTTIHDPIPMMKDKDSTISLHEDRLDLGGDDGKIGIFSYR